MNFDSIEGLTEEQIAGLYENLVEHDTDNDLLSWCNCYCNGYDIPCYYQGVIVTRWGTLYGVNNACGCSGYAPANCLAICSRMSPVCYGKVNPPW